MPGDRRRRGGNQLNRAAAPGAHVADPSARPAGDAALSKPRRDPAQTSPSPLSTAPRPGPVVIAATVDRAAAAAYARRIGSGNNEEKTTATRIGSFEVHKVTE